jgi:hypothetical protein
LNSCKGQTNPEVQKDLLKEVEEAMLGSKLTDRLLTLG